MFPPSYRSYVILAETVQTNLLRSQHGRNTVLVRTEDTRDVIQPSGRLAAQVGHASALLTFELIRALSPAHREKVIKEGTALPPLTRITLAARDSFELHHIGSLLTRFNTPFVCFEDDNEAVYGPRIQVPTVIATWPMDKEDAIGILDYLPLWKAEEMNNEKL